MKTVMTKLSLGVLMLGGGLLNSAIFATWEVQFPMLWTVVSMTVTAFAAYWWLVRDLNRSGLLLVVGVWVGLGMAVAAQALNPLPLFYWLVVALAVIARVPEPAAHAIGVLDTDE